MLPARAIITIGMTLGTAATKKLVPRFWKVRMRPSRLNAELQTKILGCGSAVMVIRDDKVEGRRGLAVGREPA